MKMPNFEIRTLQEKEYPLWDEFVERSNKGTLFHKSSWLKASGLETVIYGCFTGNEIAAGLPLIRRSECFIVRGSLAPFTPYSGIIFKDYNTYYVNRLSYEKEISREFAHRLKQDFHVVNFFFPPGSFDLQPFIWEQFTTSVRYSYLMNLESDLQSIYTSMADTLRRNLSKAEKDGIHVVISDDFQRVSSMVHNTFAKQNISLDYQDALYSYNALLKSKQQSKAFVTLNKEDTPIAAIYIVWDNKRSYYILGGFNQESGHIGGTAMALWEAVKFTKCKLGLKEFDFAGSMIPQIEKFLRKFGGILTPYFSVNYSNLNFFRQIMRKWISLNYRFSLLSNSKYNHKT